MEKSLKDMTPQEIVGRYRKLDEPLLYQSKMLEFLDDFNKALYLLTLVVPLEDDDLTWSEGAGWHCEHCDRCASEDKLDEFEHAKDCWTVVTRAFLKKHVEE